MIRGLLAALVVACVLAAPAGAHEGTPGLDNVVDSVTPAVPGVTIQVVSTVVDQVVAENTTATPLVVLAPSGEPFLQIGAAGVFANLTSPTWEASNNPAGVSSASQKGAPQKGRWVRVSAGHSWGWFDTRLPSQNLPPPGSFAVNLASWTIPMVYGKQAVTVAGHLQFQPVTGSVVARLLTAPPSASGLQLAVLPGGATPGMFAAWSGPAPVTVLGSAGEPFLRFSSVGTEANTASPTWAFFAQAQGRPPDGVVDAAGSPRWKLVSASPRLAWLDPRAVYAPGTPTPDVQSRLVPTDLIRWSVSIDFAGRRAVVAGVTQWVPDASRASTSQRAAALRAPQHTPSHTWWIALATAMLVVVGVALSRSLPRPRTG